MNKNFSTEQFIAFLQDSYHYKNIHPVGGGMRFSESLNQLYTAESPHGDKLFIKRCQDVQICRNEYSHAKALWLMDKEHFIRPFDYCDKTPLSFVSFEYCPGKPLGKLIEDKEVGSEHVCTFVEDLYTIFQHLKTSDVMHRDIHRFNFMLWKNNLRLIDFQLSVSKKNYHELDLFNNIVAVLRLGPVNIQRFAWDDAYRFLDLLDRFIAPLGIPAEYKERYEAIRAEIAAHVGKESIRYKVPSRGSLLALCAISWIKSILSTKKKRRDMYKERVSIYWSLFKGVDLGQCRN